MSTDKTHWDHLSQRFTTHQRGASEVHPDVAVNVHIGWPTIRQLVQVHGASVADGACAILDYGCRDGALYLHLHA